MNSVENNDYTLKELPTRELKFKRHKDRKVSPTIPPVRLRLKSRSSPLSSENDVEKVFSDRSISSSPDSFSQEHSPLFNRMYKFSPPATSISISPSLNEMCEPFQYSKIVKNEDAEQPLDMSKKKNQEPSSAIKDYQKSQLQLRPSVITCASALLRTHCNFSDIAHQMCATKASDSNLSETLQFYDQKKKESESDECKIIKSVNGQEILSGSCDPVIDEHFRRSLGKDYQQIFSKSSGNNVSITVDEHFAKALGETWHQIQSKVPTADSLSSHSPSSLQSSQSAHILSHPPGVVS